jgi:hypothetical protein
MDGTDLIAIFAIVATQTIIFIGHIQHNSIKYPLPLTLTHFYTTGVHCDVLFIMLLLLPSTGGGGLAAFQWPLRV